MKRKHSAEFGIAILLLVALAMLMVKNQAYRTVVDTELDTLACDSVGIAVYGLPVVDTPFAVIYPTKEKLTVYREGDWGYIDIPLKYKDCFPVPKMLVYKFFNK